MRRADAFLVTAAGVVAAAVIASGGGRLPTAQAESSTAPKRLLALATGKAPLNVAVKPPDMVYNMTVLAPVIIRAKRAAISEVKREINAVHGRFERAGAGETLRVSLTQYCLKGYTRRDNYVQLGIVAADPRVFPLARYVDITLGKTRMGRFLVDDTGGNVKGLTLDIWNPSCHEARRFGRQWGTATLVTRADEESEPITRTFESPPQP